MVSPKTEMLFTGKNCPNASTGRKYSAYDITITAPTLSTNHEIGQKLVQFAITSLQQFKEDNALLILIHKSFC